MKNYNISYQTMVRIKTWLCAISLLLISKVYGQKALRINIKVMADTVKVGNYDLKEHSKKNHVFLKMGYGEYDIKNAREIKNVKGNIIEHVDLVYSGYPSDIDIDALNKKRLASLYIHYPEIFENTMVSWSFVCQTNCKNDYEASQLFHGVVIKYRPPATIESIAGEKEYLQGVIDGKVVVLDSTVLKVMDRHKTWKEMVIVGDFTGSMSPYIAQVLLWHSLNVKRKAVKHFVFFNDGNMTADDKKVIGCTGGIYSTSGNTLDSALQTALQTISNGYGGDGPENDIEALIYAQDKYPDCKELVLIADNMSDMRDISLIGKIKIPVRIILCGTYAGVNPQYLELARSTKGSIHTIEKDLTELMKKNDGEIVAIGNYRFRIMKGKFYPVF